MKKKRQQNIKQTIRRNYGKIALEESSEGTCCAPGCCSSTSPAQAAAYVGYDANELGSVPQASVLGVGCGAPVKFADLQKGETVVDLGSGAGIDVFLSANTVGRPGRVVGIDMTEEMLERARRNAKKSGYANVEFRKGDIEERIPVDESSIDAVISNCVINLTTDKVKAFKEIHRILKGGGRMVISDLVADRKADSINLEMWSSCIDGALAKNDYLASIRKAGFKEIGKLEERQFMGGALGLPFVAIAPFAGVAAMVYAFGLVSMAHFNPAVTIGFLVSGHIKKSQLPVYLGAEIIGALLASLFVLAFIGGEADLGANAPDYSFPLPLIFGVEVLVTALLMAVIFAVVYTKGMRGWSGIAIGRMVGLNIFFFSFISGASMNPARSLAPALVSGAVADLWLYWSATFAGSFIVALLCRKKFKS